MNYYLRMFFSRKVLAKANTYDNRIRPSCRDNPHIYHSVRIMEYIWLDYPIRSEID